MTSGIAATGGGRGQRFIVIGATVVAQRVCGTLATEAADVIHLTTPTDQQLREIGTPEPDGVAVVMHDDVACLRYALAVAHLYPRARLVVSIFDRTVGRQLAQALPDCVIASPADVGAPTLVAACLEQDVVGVWQDTGRAECVRRIEDGYALEPYQVATSLRWRARFGRLLGQLRPYDMGSRILLAGLFGLIMVLLADLSWSTQGLGHDWITAWYEAVTVVSTVGPAAAGEAPAAYRIFATTAMLATIVFTATFTAGLVHRIMGGRALALIGARVPPRDGHVVVVGLGQVGLRLCVALRALGLGVIAVERDPAAENLRIARAHRIPVLVANGGDRGVLARLRLDRAVALAAVGSDQLDNVAVAVTALAVAPQIRIVIRAGEGEAIEETRSLFQIAETRDISVLSATYIVLALRHIDPIRLFSDGVHVCAQLGGDEFADCTTRTPRCAHFPPEPGVRPLGPD